MSLVCRQTPCESAAHHATQNRLPRQSASIRPGALAIGVLCDPRRL